MKRSEMVRELTNLIYTSKHVDVPTRSYINDEGLANKILDCIEELGMLPPTSTCYIVDSPRGLKHSHVGHWWDNEDGTPKE